MRIEATRAGQTKAYSIALAGRRIVGGRSRVVATRCRVVPPAAPRLITADAGDIPSAIYGVDVADHGLSAFMNVDVLDASVLLSVSTKPPESVEEARLILFHFPGCGISETELAVEMENSRTAS